MPALPDLQEIRVFKVHDDRWVVRGIAVLPHMDSGIREEVESDVEAILLIEDLTERLVNR